MTLNEALALACASLLAALFALLLTRRAFKAMPIFFAYAAYSGSSAIIAQSILRSAPGSYMRFYIAAVAVDGLFYFCVLAELGRNVARHNRATPPHWLVGTALFGLVALLTVYLAGWPVPTGRTSLSALYYLQMRALEILEFAGFLTLVSWSSLQRLRWPDRELHIATGLGILSFTWFVVAIMHAQFTVGAWYQRLDRAGEAVELAVFAYWLHYFWLVEDRETAASQASNRPAVRRSRDGTKRTAASRRRTARPQRSRTIA